MKQCIQNLRNDASFHIFSYRLISIYECKSETFVCNSVARPAIIQVQFHLLVSLIFQVWNLCFLVFSVDEVAQIISIREFENSLRRVNISIFR